MGILFKRKQGGEKYLSIWWFLILAIIGVGIVAGVWVFSSADVDVRGIESGILVDRVVNCIVDTGSLNESFVSNEIFDSCGLDEKMINESGDYYLEIKVYDLEGCDLNNVENCKVLKEKSFGYFDLKTQCGITSGKNSENFAKCGWKKVYVVDDGKNALLYVFAGVNHNGGKNV